MASGWYSFEAHVSGKVTHCGTIETSPDEIARRFPGAMILGHRVIVTKRPPRVPRG